MENLNDKELFEVYQQTKKDFKNTIEGSQEENNSHDKLILISNEMDSRNFDLKIHMKGLTMVTINSVYQKIEGLIAIHDKNTNRLYSSTTQKINGTNIAIVFKQIYVYNFTNKEYILIDKEEYKEYHKTEYRDFVLYVDILNSSLIQELEKNQCEQICPNIESWISKQQVINS